MTCLTGNTPQNIKIMMFLMNFLIMMFAHYDNHDNAWLHWNDVLKGLDVGGGPVVRDGDDLGFAELHAQGPANLGH